MAESAPTIDFHAPGVRGVLHPASPGNPERGPGSARAGLVLAHGAGSDCRAPLLVAAARAFADAGLTVLRCDLPFRQIRPAGPPPPAAAERDRAGLAAALTALAGEVPGPIFLGGHSYGGRQASLLAAEQPDITPALLLLSYPLHPPRRPHQLRTAHFPRLLTPAFFVHGLRDSFGSPEELRAALTVLPAPSQLLLLPGGHDLRSFPNHAARVTAEFRTFAFR